MASVQEGLDEGREGGSRRVERDSFETALREQAAKGRSESAPAPSAADQIRASGDSIKEFLASTDDGTLDRNVAAGLRAGGPQAPGAEQLEKLEKIGIDSGTFTGKEVADALAAAQGHSDELEALKSEDAIGVFYDAADDAEGNPGLLAEAVADLSEAVAAGVVPVSAAREVVLDSVLDVYGFEADDLEDPEVAEQVDTAVTELVEFAAQISERRQAQADIDAAPQLAKARSDEMMAILRAWAKDVGIRTDAEANRRFAEAQKFLEGELGVSLERMLYDPDPESWDAKAWESVLRAGDAVVMEERRRQRTAAFHRQLVGTELSDGYTLAGVQQNPRVLAEPKLDPDRVVRRAQMRRASGDAIRAALTETPSTSVEDGLREGRS